MKRLSKCLNSRAVCAMFVAAVLVAAPGSAQAGFGDGFGFAEVHDPDTSTSAPAFAPADRAFWAGACDLDGGSAAIGSLPLTPFANCIEHLDYVYGPLAPGESPAPTQPDGWIQLDVPTFDPSQIPGVLASGPAWRVSDVTAAGARPDGSTSFWFTRSRELAPNTVGSSIAPDGAPRDVAVKLPPGVVGNPMAVPMCQPEDFDSVPVTCPPKTQVGVSTVSESDDTYVVPVYNVEPRDGVTAEFIMSGLGTSGLRTNVPVVARARTEGDFGVDAGVRQIPSGVVVTAQSFTLWAVPWAKSHDRYRPTAAYCGHPGSGRLGTRLTGLPGGFANGCSQEPQSYDPSWGPVRPFFTTQTECSAENPVTSILATNWHTPVVAEEESVAPLVTDCADLEFPASIAFEGTDRRADSASGLLVDLAVAQHNDPPASLKFNADDDSGAPAYWDSAAGRGVSHLKDSVVSLPEGFSVNPSAATGLDGCSDAQIGLLDASTSPPLFDNEDPFDGAGTECPQASVIGTAKLTTPLLEKQLSGEVVLGTPKSTDPQSGEMLRLFIVIRNRERGLLAKVYGSAKADPTTGQLTATFENNPQLPFDDLKLAFKGGQRGVLATPRACNGENEWTSSLQPWSGNAPVDQTGQLPVDQDCANDFSPTLAAGMDTQAARSSGTFSFKFARSQGQQYLRGLTARLPQGLLASVKDVPLCSNAAADAGGCPAGSKIGLVDAKAGSGDPFVLEEKGEVFLTEGYKGGEYGLAVKVRPVAGPFRGAMELSPIIVRQAIHVDRTTAQVTAVSDPFPLTHHGVPLRVREVTVLINRGGFMLNPSDCAAKQVGADISSDQGSNAGLVNGFQASGCAGLAFKPKLSLQLTGRKQVKTGKHPGIKAVVTQQGVPEAGIEKAVVRLPKSLALDVNNAQALCEYVDGIKPDLENHCPKGSIVGRARAVSPLLNDPLVGNVYFVKNIRIDPKTGNQIRTLPMIVVALRGEVNVNLKGESDTQKGKLVNTFANVPDAPISQFNLNINGGSKGIIAVTRTRRSLINLCASGRQVAEADMDGQNGRRHDFDIAMRKPCTKAQTKAAKRKAKRAAKRAAAYQRRR